MLCGCNNKKEKNATIATLGLQTQVRSLGSRLVWYGLFDRHLVLYVPESAFNPGWQPCKQSGHVLSDPNKSQNQVRSG